jgi:hypothetical protein
MPEINLVDSSLNNYLDELELSLQVCPGGFTFCLHSSVDKQIRAFRHYKFVGTLLMEDLLQNTGDILQKDELLRLTFKTARVIYSGRKSTLVPSVFVRDEYLKRILEFNQPLDDLDEVHLNPLSGCGSHLVFALPTYFAGLISEKFKNTVYYNQATPVLTYALSHIDVMDKNIIYLQLNKEFFDMVIIQERRLTLYNSFLYVNSTDLLYFILYACKQLKVDTAQTPFLLVGEYASDPSLTKELTDYIPNLRSIDKLPAMAFGEKLRTTTRQRFFGLIHLHQCE